VEFDKPQALLRDKESSFFQLAQSLEFAGVKAVE
jgi:hypothetical protein